MRLIETRTWKWLLGTGTLYMIAWLTAMFASDWPSHDKEWRYASGVAGACGVTLYILYVLDAVLDSTLTPRARWVWLIGLIVIVIPVQVGYFIARVWVRRPGDGSRSTNQSRLPPKG